MNDRPTSILRFGDFEFNQLSGELRRRGLRVRLTPQAKELLRLLLAPPIRPHSREEIHDALWPERSFMDLDPSLNKVIHSIRDALCDTGPNNRFIETLPRFGYRFFPEWLQSSSEKVISVIDGSEFPIAVLPIRVADPTAELIFVGNRITSILTDALTEIKGIRVRAETTVRNHLTKSADPQRAGELMGVRAVLSGEASLHDHEFLIRIEVVDVFDGAQLSSAEIETTFPFEKHVEKKIADDLLGKIKPSLLVLAGSKLGAFVA